MSIYNEENDSIKRVTIQVAAAPLGAALAGAVLASDDRLSGPAASFSFNGPTLSLCTKAQAE